MQILHSGMSVRCQVFNTEKGTADKCTWCYHRITKASYLHVFRHVPWSPEIGDLKDPDSEINKILDKERINVLKPDLGTKPKVYYVGLDREVR